MLPTSICTAVCRARSTRWPGHENLTKRSSLGPPFVSSGRMATRQRRSVISPTGWGLPVQSYNAFVTSDLSFADRSTAIWTRRFARNRPIRGNLAPRQAIIAFFEEIVERSISDKERKGCLLVNSALEVAPHDFEFQRIVAKAQKQLEAFFYRCVAAGQADGTIAKFQSAERSGQTPAIGGARHSSACADPARPSAVGRPAQAGLCAAWRIEKSRRAGAAPVRLSADRQVR